MQANIFEEVFPKCFAKFLGEFIRCEYMPRLYSHPREYQIKILLNFLGIGFLPGPAARGYVIPAGYRFLVFVLPL